MLREPNLTGGIGAKTAHNIPESSSKNARSDLILTSATSVLQEKRNKNA